MKENMIVRRDPKAFYFNFDWSENVDQSLKQNWICYKKQGIFS